jgi:2-polyprenyl-3-methyl-5-hydroxy-6-metoxy-1,4-benzoquinol methylase
MDDAQANDADVAAAVAHAQRAASELARLRHGPALQSMLNALRLAPGMAVLWAQFSELIQVFNFRHPAHPFLREVLARALEHPAVEPADLVRPVSSIALSRPGEALEEPLLLRLLEDVVVPDVRLERLIVASRREALDAVFARPRLPLAALIAIAHQAFNTEYVYAESAQDAPKLDRLHGEIAAAAEAPLHWLAVYACYRPLSTLTRAEELAAKLAGTPLAALARRQILEPLEEQRLRSSIPASGGRAGSVSSDVQAQYEANPYPRWVRTQIAPLALPLSSVMGQLFPAAARGMSDAAPRILVAGCGTGRHSISTALRFAHPSILAVDLSMASLAYAKRKTRELGIGSIEYRQADLLTLGSLAERFDLVECWGVLHHLADPFAGWQVLASLLKPGAIMRVALYSELGRRDVARARDIIAAEGFAATPEGIRRCRQAIIARETDGLLAKLARSEDFYSLSGCRDLLFHVREHRFGLAQIGAMIDRLGMRFIGFEFPDAGATAARYRARFPDDRRLLDLGNWHRLEQEHPDTFAKMYRFGVQKRA